MKSFRGAEKLEEKKSLPPAHASSLCSACRRIPSETGLKDTIREFANKKSDCVPPKDLEANDA